MKNSENTIDAIKQRAAHLLCEGQSGKVICATLKIDPTTLCRWKQQAAFASYVNALLRTLEQESLTMLRAARVRSLDRAAEFLESTDARTALRAIACILEHSMPVTPLVEPDTYDYGFEKVLEQLRP